MHQVLPQQLARGHVDAAEYRIALADRALPLAKLARGTFQHEQAEVDDQPDLLGDGDEFGR